MKILFSIIILTIGANVYSQNISSDYEPINKKNSVILEPILKTSKVNYQPAFLIGGSLGFVLLNEFEISAKVSVLMNDVSPYYKIFIPENPKLELMYYGLNIGYKTSFSNSFSAGISLFSGYGKINYKHPSETFQSSIQSKNEKNFWIIEPEVNYSYNLMDWIGLKLGINYRTIFAVEEIHFNTSINEYDIPMDLNSFNIEFGLYLKIFSF